MVKEQITHLLDSRSGIFFRRFIAKPGQIGSIAPSSPSLVSKMLGLVDWNIVGGVAELGAGTGVVTAELMKRIRPGASLTVFELDGKLREGIETSLGIDVCADAGDMTQIFRPRSLDLVISSLPWTTLPRHDSAKILSGILTRLKPDGQFIAYQYSWHMHHLFRRIFRSVELSFVLKNIPPAFVYNCHCPNAGAAESISTLLCGGKE